VWHRDKVSRQAGPPAMVETVEMSIIFEKRVVF
jgi:hypothetical protein